MPRRTERRGRTGASAVRGLLQVAAYAVFALALVHFSSAPAYRRYDPGTALVRLSIAHATARREPCRERSAAEIAAMPPNMRRPSDCARERVDLHLELDVDGLPAYAGRAAPSGLARDGEAVLYTTLPLPAGPRVLDVRLRDTPRTAGFDHRVRYEAALGPGEILVVEFDTANGGFRFR